MVMTIELWPRRSLIAFIGTPAAKPVESNVPALPNTCAWRTCSEVIRHGW
jgi:hypothetical protein